VLGWRGVPNQAGNSAVVSGVISVSLAQNTAALRLASVSGGKEAWMVMEVDAGLVGWLGSVGSGEAFPIRRVILRWCLG
jgi:hypothetical protein